MEFSKHPKLTKWISFFLIFSLGNLAIGQKNDYSGLESIYEGILQGYNRNLRPGKIRLLCRIFQCQTNQTLIQIYLCTHQRYFINTYASFKFILPASKLTIGSI
jgi:hypothetical protein